VSDVSFIKFKNDLYTAEARTNFRIIQIANYTRTREVNEW